MAEIPRSLLDEYAQQLNVLSKAGQQLVLNALNNAEWNSVTELRAIMVEVMCQVCEVVSDDAVVVASNRYDDIRQLSVGSRLGAVSEPTYNPAATAGAVRALVQSVVISGTTKQFAGQLASRVDYEVKLAANKAAENLAKRDPLKPRWARVPSGAETCEFCLVLASRGFVYHTGETASHAHANCDCQIVQGYPNMSVEGYDPDALYERYRQCYKAVADKYGHADIKDVLAEMRRRDPLWLNSGTAGTISIEAGASPFEKEKTVAKWLSEQGFNVTFRATRSLEGRKTSDVFLNGVAWEIKQPIGSGRRNISNQFNEATGQSNKLIIDVSKSPWKLSDIEMEASRQLSLRDNFDEVLLVGEGYLRRYKW